MTVALGRGLQAASEAEAARKRNVLATIARLPDAELARLRDWVLEMLPSMPSEKTFAAKNLIACAVEELTRRGIA